MARYAREAPAQDAPAEYDPLMDYAVSVRRRRPAAPQLTLDERQRALLGLGRWLQESGYEFTSITPESHRRINARPGNGGPGSGLRDIFGWNRSFNAGAVHPGILELMQQADIVEREGEHLKSRVRFATLDEMIFVHGAFPTTSADAVFFGPDTYRFASLLKHALASSWSYRVRHVVDVGCGSGAGGLVAARTMAPQTRLTLADVNPAALRLAMVNAALNNAPFAQTRQSDLLAQVQGPIDLIVCNPPYLADPHQRVYRNGGGLLGCGLSVRMVGEALARLAPGGRLVLYTGSAVVDGVDVFFNAVLPLLLAAHARYEYGELDPDVFGEELDTEAYSSVDRIAAVGLVVQVAGGRA